MNFLTKNEVKIMKHKVRVLKLRKLLNGIQRIKKDKKILLNETFDKLKVTKVFGVITLNL